MKHELGSDRPQKTVVTNQFLDFDCLMLQTLLLFYHSEPPL